MSFFRNIFSENHKLENNSEDSFIDLKIRISGELLKQVLTYLLTASITVGGAYTFFDNVIFSNSEQQEQVDQNSKTNNSKTF